MFCKWGYKLSFRKRRLPSGKPSESLITIKQGDPTWELEEKYFKKISKKIITNFENDLIIKKYLKDIK